MLVLPKSTQAALSARWADLRLRFISALVLAPVALACVWFGGTPWFILVMLAGAGVCWEWFQMARHSPSELAAGWIYCALAILALGWLRAGIQDGRAILFFLLAIVWSSDIGAYVAGRVLGGPKLAPAISPGKTWSGAAGGLGAAIVVGIIAAVLWNGAVAPAMMGAAILGIASQLGDLLESAAKRRFGVKDSGRLIPGHGGLLDRLDGLMAAALVAAAWIWIAGQGAATWH